MNCSCCFSRCWRLRRINSQHCVFNANAIIFVGGSGLFVLCVSCVQFSIIRWLAFCFFFSFVASFIHLYIFRIDCICWVVEVCVYVARNLIQLSTQCHRLLAFSFSCHCYARISLKFCFLYFCLYFSFFCYENAWWWYLVGFFFFFNLGDIAYHHSLKSKLISLYKRYDGVCVCVCGKLAAYIERIDRTRETWNATTNVI